MKFFDIFVLGFCSFPVALALLVFFFLLSMRIWDWVLMVSQFLSEWSRWHTALRHTPTARRRRSPL